MSRDNIHISEEHLMAYLAKEADDQLVKQIDHWLSLSDENVAMLDELTAAWIQSGLLKTKPVVVDVDAAWGKLSEKMDAAEVRQLDSSRRRVAGFTRVFIPIAAVLVIALGLWIVRNESNRVGIQTFISMNEVLEMDLEDGSKVSLNNDSKIVYPEEFAEETREVELEGEAYFKVEPNEKKPFVIRADDAYIKVLGTSFNVKALNDEKLVEVYVEEGIVMLFTIETGTNDTLSVILNVGETGVFNRETKQVSKVGKTDIEVLYWLNKSLIFEETDLGTVFEILQITYNVTVTAEDSTVNNCKLNSTFKNEKIDYILDVIAITFGLEVKKNEDQTYILIGEGC